MLNLVSRSGSSGCTDADPLWFSLQLLGLTKTWTWTWTSRMLNGGLRPVDLLIFGGWKPWTLVSKQWTSQVDFGD